MQDAFSKRCEVDLSTMRSPRGNVDIPTMLARWVRDRECRRYVKRMGPQEGRLALQRIGATVFEEDGGRYRTELLWNTSTLSFLWNDAARHEMLKRHTVMLFEAVADAIAFDVDVPVNDICKRVDVRGLEHLERALSRQGGVMLLSVYQSHPGFLRAIDTFRLARIAAVRHVSREGAPSFLLKGLDWREVPASPTGAKQMLSVLRQGGCVALYNDFVYPESTPLVSGLFGRSVAMSRAMVRIALRSRATIIPMVVLRERAGDEDVVSVDVFPPLECDVPRHACETEVARVGVLLGVATECLIRRGPSQWRLWNTLQERWKTAEVLQ